MHVQDSQISVLSRLSISHDEEALVVRRPLLTFALVGALAAPQCVAGQTGLSRAASDAGFFGGDLSRHEAMAVQEGNLTTADPEPMSVLLVSTGFLGVFVVRRGKLEESEADDS
jgi:hypothetical protein